MKKTVMLLFLICCNLAFSQLGKVYLKTPKFKVGEKNTFVYVPPKGVAIPQAAKVRLIYNNNFDLSGGAGVLTKIANGYEFSVKVPDSVKCFIAGIVDGSKVVDNNMNKGYELFLNATNSNDLGKCWAAKIELLNYGRNILPSKLNLKVDSSPEGIVGEYNKMFAKYPKMKEDKSYENYLYLKDASAKGQMKTEMLAFAKKCEKKNSEEYMIIAARLYGSLQMTEEKKKVEDQITAKYPKGNFVGSNFFFDFANHPDKTEAYILERLNLYTSTFQNIPIMYKDHFYTCLLKIYVESKDFQKIDQCENLFSNKKQAASYYNDYAWNLSGQDLVTPAKDIDFAEKLSKRSLDIIADQQKQVDFPEDLSGVYNMYADTYALVLYKQNRFEEAFQYQDKLKQMDAMDTGGKERYAGMLEKVKGPEATQKYIEEEISKGTNSPVFLAQLEAIYGKLNLPLDNFKMIKAKSVEMAAANAKAEIEKKYGSTDAINFSLKNLDGKVVNLADLKGKVVVLDFWATWCGPCKASFPAMQELVSKYKDKNVEFLFVNTWERGKENETTEKVTSFINDKKYSFNVVFDYDSSITSKYKIEGIPTKIVIDKKGSVIAFGPSEQDLMFLIDEQLSL